MNKRIKNIAIQAREQVEFKLKNPSRLQNWFMDELVQEEFAKLLIEECARVADSQMDSHLNAVNVGPEIKKHFGLGNKK